MARVLYIVARNKPLRCGYLMIALNTHPFKELGVGVKVDERRAERRRQSQPREPERRKGERRVQASLDGEFRSHGYATVVQPGAASVPKTDRPSKAAVGQVTRSSHRRGTVRAPRRRNWVWWPLRVLLVPAAAGGLSIIGSANQSPTHLL